MDVCREAKAAVGRDLQLTAATNDHQWSSSPKAKKETRKLLEKLQNQINELAPTGTLVGGARNQSSTTFSSEGCINRNAQGSSLRWKLGSSAAKRKIDFLDEEKARQMTEDSSSRRRSSRSNTKDDDGDEDKGLLVPEGSVEHESSKTQLVYILEE